MILAADVDGESDKSAVVFVLASASCCLFCCGAVDLAVPRNNCVAERCAKYGLLLYEANSGGRPSFCSAKKFKFFSRVPVGLSYVLNV